MGYTKNICIDFGNHIKEIRLSLNLTQKDVAYFCNIDKSNYNRIEKGKGNPTLKQVERIINVLRDFDYFKNKIPKFLTDDDVTNRAIINEFYIDYLKQMD